MENKYLYTLFYIIFLCFACNKFKKEQVQGTWNFVSIKNEKGKKLSIRPDIELDFDDKGNYDYSSVVKNEAYTERGAYILQNDMIVLKNGDKEAVTKQIKIMQLSNDTMLLKMKNIANDIQFLTLYRSKKQTMEMDSLELDDKDLDEKAAKQPVKKKNK